MLEFKALQNDNYESQVKIDDDYIAIEINKSNCINLLMLRFQKQRGYRERSKKIFGYIS